MLILEIMSNNMMIVNINSYRQSPLADEKQAANGADLLKNVLLLLCSRINIIMVR